MVPRPQGKSIVTFKYKARFLAMGFSYKEGIDYDETFSPVSRLESIIILLSYSYYMNFKLFNRTYVFR